MEERLCWWCKYFSYSNQTPGYSELTPGYEFEMSCLKGVWELDTYNTSEQEFRKMISFAKSCADFVHGGK